jgi:hypothetical protein
MSNKISWQPDNFDSLPAKAKTPTEISEYAVQLSVRDKKQIVSAFKAAHFEMAMSYLWGKTVNALQKELSAVGVGLLGEMLGKTDVDEDADVEDILTTKDTIRLSEELGVVTSTDAMRLRHTHELITHFSQLEIGESDQEEIDEAEAILALKTCVRSVLGRPKVEVAKKFVDFRGALENETISEADPRVSMLQSSPYFYCKLTVSVLMSAAKKNTGASLEHALANINVLIPAIWMKLRETEKWQVGQAYAETYTEGKTTSVGGLKNALLKVKGFDYVPENLRSDTFVKAASDIFKAHDGMNNFHNEVSAVRNLSKLGTTIPTPALPACFSALLCVTLGNRYGVSWNAESDALELLSRMTSDRWRYYLNSVLPGDIRTINKLLEDKPRKQWVTIGEKFSFNEIDIKNKTVNNLIKATISQTDSRIILNAKKLLEEYYGKTS